MAQDTTPAVVIYQGDGKNQIFSVPFDKGNYGTIRVAFVRRGLTEYEYNPTTYTVDGHLYAWDLGGDPKQYRYTKSDDSRVYDANNVVIEGIVIESMFDSSIRFSDGVAGYRARAKDIVSCALVEWLGTPLTSDDWICIVRDTKTGQPYTYSNNQKHIEGALDNLSRQIQELKAQSEASLKVDPTYVQDRRKLNAIDWLNTIARSTDGTARSFRYKDMWLEYSTDNPDKAEDQKSWTRVLNTNNITTVREFYNKETGERIPQYSKDGGVTWTSFTASIAENTYTKSEIDNKVMVINAGLDANAEAIQKTRDDYIAADSEIYQILNNHASELTTLRGNQASLGDQVAGIEGKIPESASGTNHLITKQQLLDEEMDIRADMNQTDSELQAQITVQAAAIATLDSEKLDKNQGDINAGKYLIVGNDGNIELTTSGGGGGGGLGSVAHDNTLSGAGTDESPLGLAEAIKDEIADKAPKETVEALTTAVSDIILNYLQKSGGTMTGGLTLPELTVSTAEGTFTVSVVAGVVTIATNNGLDIASHVKFDHAPTTDDNTTWANALDTSLVRKAQVATALANIDALPEQTGNAGKVLTTDGSTASWQDPSGGTTITLKEYDE